MKKIVFLMTVAVVLGVATAAQASLNWNAKFQLHYAGAHDAKANTCDFVSSNCTSDIVVDADATPLARYDIYVIAMDTEGIAGLRYGIACTGDFYFYGWTNCADLEIPTTGWPGCGEANAQTWVTEQPGGHVTAGIIDLYIYANSEKVCTEADVRVGFAEWCDGTSPEPLCNNTIADEIPPGAEAFYFGCVGFNGTSGVKNCDVIATKEKSWGAIKALYK